MLYGVASVDERREVLDWDSAAAMAIDNYGQVNHGLDNAGYFFTESEVSEFWETLSELRKRESDAIVEF